MALRKRGICRNDGATSETLPTREYIYNLLPQQTCPLNAQKRLPKIRRRKTPPPPLPDAVPKASHKTMGPPPHPHHEIIQPPDKIPFKPKHWRTPYMDQKCIAEKVKVATAEFEKLKVETTSTRRTNPLSRITKSN